MNFVHAFCLYVQIITLGAEVAGVLTNVSGSKDRTALLSGTPTETEWGNLTIPTVHLAHPGIVMRRGTEKNPWPKRHREEHIRRGCLAVGGKR